MSDQSIAGRGTERPGGGQAPRLAVIDTDSGLLRVLGKRLDRLGGEYRVVGWAVLGGVVGVDPLVWGGGAWEQLGRVCGELPELGVVVCTGPSSVAQRVRG